MSGPEVALELARGALDWLLTETRPAGSGPDLYSGASGTALTLLEGHHAFGDDAYAAAAERTARTIAAAVDETGDSSLYFGLSGMAFALHTVGDRLGEPWAAAAGRRALDRIRSRFDGERWSDLFELLGGNAGIALAALAMGDGDLAVLAVEPYLRRAETTPHGVTWQHRRGVDSRLHHISHGALGIAHSLAAVGRATGRADLVAAALAGAAEVVSRDEAGPDGFLVPHSDPPYRPELIERYSYGWCHGPTGDAQVFRLLAAVTGDPAWPALADRCWHTVTHSGLPRRLRPGFWDNSGRCCGTAGVLAFACDQYAAGRADLSFAGILVDDLRARATVDAAGARWSNHEHRVTPSDLAPEPGWAMGNVGIARELLRYARTAAGEPSGYVVDWPDRPL